MTSRNEHDELKDLLLKNRPLPPTPPVDEAQKIWAQISSVEKKSTWKSISKPLFALAASLVLVLSVILSEKSLNQKLTENLAESEVALVNDSMDLGFLENENPDEIDSSDMDSYDLVALIE